MSDISDDSFEESQLSQDFFEAAKHVEQSHPKIKTDDLLYMYGLYKLSTNGPCNIPKPGILNAQARAKWTAWKKFGNIEKEKAMEMYIKKVLEIDPNFKLNKKSQWVCVSTHEWENEEIQDCHKTVFDYVKENNLQKLKDNLCIQEVNILDDSGLGLIHWAADRNAVEVLEFLLLFGADVNLQDVSKQTALHYASSCGHLDCIKLLLKYNAQKDLQDEDGLNCLDVAFDESVRELLKN